MSGPVPSKPASSPAKALAMVLAREARLPDPEAFHRELARTRRVKVAQNGEEMWALEVDGEPSVVALMPVPIPWSQLEGPCATAWWWPEATAACKPCPAHYVVSTQSVDGNVFSANLRLTAIVSALVKAADAPAVYWGAGSVVRSGADFCEQAATATRDRLPLGLWLDFRVTPEGENDLFFATTGMAALGLMEIESVAPRASADIVLNRIFNAAHYLCDRGPVLHDGHTFGFSADEKIVISHRASARATRGPREGNVIFLELPK